MTDQLATFAAAGIALYAAHHVGDYWVQTDDQAQRKGSSPLHCLAHVLSYLGVQALFLVPLIPLGLATSWWQIPAALAVSGVTHYAADRREHGLMFRLARRLPGKARFLTLGVPRTGIDIERWDKCPACQGTGEAGMEQCWDCRGGGTLPGSVGDNPTLATGAWALDQAWHIFWGVFVAALVIAA